MKGLRLTVSYTLQSNHGKGKRQRNEANIIYLCLSWTDNITKWCVFIRGFKTVADLFGIQSIIYEGVVRPGAENEHGIQAAWDDLNRIALEKLKFYVTMRVDDIVTNGDRLMAR